MSARFLGLENRTMADGSNPLPWLRMFPPAVCFKDAEADTVYTAEVTLRNADSRPHAVKIIAPKSKRFHLVGDDFISVRLSPGLTTTFEVAFATDEEKDFWDACVVQTEVGTAELPLAARAPSCDVVVAGNLDLGVVALGNAVSSTLVVRNRGTRPAPFHVEWDRGYGEQVKIEPDSGTVAGGDFVEIASRARPSNSARSTSSSDVAIDGGRERRPFPLAAMVVPHAFELLGDGPDAARVEEMTFGNVLRGDAKRMSCAVYNNGPVAARIRRARRAGGGPRARDARRRRNDRRRSFRRPIRRRSPRRRGRVFARRAGGGNPCAVRASTYHVRVASERDVLHARVQIPSPVRARRRGDAQIPRRGDVRGSSSEADAADDGARDERVPRARPAGFGFRPRRVPRRGRPPAQRQKRQQGHGGGFHRVAHVLLQTHAGVWANPAGTDGERGDSVRAEGSGAARRGADGASRRRGRRDRARDETSRAGHRARRRGETRADRWHDGDSERFSPRAEVREPARGGQGDGGVARDGSRETRGDAGSTGDARAVSNPRPRWQTHADVRAGAREGGTQDGIRGVHP